MQLLAFTDVSSSKLMKTLKAYNKKQSNTAKSKLLLILMATKQSQPDDDDSVACLVAIQITVQQNESI